jgi:hypothetical protein
MVPVAGGIGIGALLGWLVGSRNQPFSDPAQSVLLIVPVSALLAGEVFFYTGPWGVIVFILSLVSFALLHRGWRLFLEEHAKNRPGEEPVEV